MPPITWRPSSRTALAVLLASLAGCAGLTEPQADPIPPDAPPPVPPAPGPLSYRFGAKFEPPVGRVLHGVGQWESYNAKYAALLPATEQPAAELIFVDLGDTLRPWEPDKLAGRIAAVAALGRIPSLDLALRGLQPGAAQVAQLPDPLYGIDDEVAATTIYDSRITDVIAVARAFGKPLIMRIGGEFSGPWNGYHPYDFPKAFRKIVQMFRLAGADNVAFVWCYEPAAPNDFDAVNAAGDPKWYPGADVVDWFAIDLFAAHDVSGPTTGASGALTPFGRTLRFLDMAVAHNKPVMIAESAPSQFDLGSTTGAAAAWTDWFTPYFGLITSRPEILWFHYINYDWTQAGYYQAIGWQNNDLGANGALAGLYQAELAKPKYLHSGERSLLKDYDKYQ